MFNNPKKTIQWQGYVLSILLSCVSVASIEAASPKQTVKEGNLLYEQGDYVASLKKYQKALEKDTESDIINFNLGTALYKEGEYEKAVDHFQKVFLSEEDPLKHKAYYNSGNALYKSGLIEEQRGSAAHAIPLVEQSLKQYKRALEIHDEDEDTKHNLAFVQKELKRLQEIRQQQQQQKGDQQEESEKSQNQDQQQQQDQGQQSQSSQGQEEQDSQQPEQKNQQQNLGQEQDQQDSQEDKNQQNTGAQSLCASELTPQEAQMRLEGYQQKEEPQRLLNMQPKKIYSTPVLKDW